MGYPQWIANVVQVVAGGGIIRSSSAADEQSRRRQDMQDRATQTWEDARNSANAGYDGLRTQHGGGYDPAVLVGDKLEPFDAWSHQRIWDAIESVKAGRIVDSANMWQTLATDTNAARDAFANAIDKSVRDKMQGQTAGAFIDSMKAFSNDLGKLTVAQRLVSRAMGLQADYLGQAKDSIPQPGHGPSALLDWVVDKMPVPAQNYFKGSQYRAEEAERDAQRIMTTVYQQNVVRDVDPARPVLPTPSSPVNGPGGNDSRVGPGGQSDGRTGGGVSPGGDGGQSGPSDGGTGGTDGRVRPEGAGSQQDSTHTGSGQDATTNPASATDPAGMASGNPNAGAGSGTPGGGGTSSGSPSGSSQGGTSGVGGGAGFVPGRSGGGVGGGANSGAVRPGLPGGQGGPGGQAPGGAAAARAAGVRAAQAGMPGAPGMGAPGARGNDDDEREVKTKDYLIYDRGSELLGELPPALPPGGVIGA
ncbi:hypothetical protein NDR86_17610 [Nocardia sp. CDC141]|uniref:PPE family protein n=1 Tax=Nocardia pulmonis TaxID=2951408 RepID=A0A9X2E995_9NOCA|nr:hypothetical protein [Nocardia sp. CDC159]MCM6775293.1 hypothetical protein [Nocardia pulmonis]